MMKVTVSLSSQGRLLERSVLHFAVDLMKINSGNAEVTKKMAILSKKNGIGFHHT